MAKRQSTVKGLLIAITAILCVAVFLNVALNAEVGFFSVEKKSTQATEDFVKFIDVGQGDSILIGSDGYYALIDTGTAESGLDLTECLMKSGVKSLDVLILSHLHSDHTGGVPQLFDSFEVKNLILPELSTYSEGIYSAELAIDKVTRSKGGVYSAVQGMNFLLGEFEITVLMKFSDFTDENNRSLIIMAEKDNRKFLFTGDMEIKAEKALLKEGLNLNCDVLKVAHHGSSTSSCKDFLTACEPENAVISCGEGNTYNHPHRETLNSFEKRKIPIYRTDKQGDITFFVDNGKMRVETEIN